MQMDISSGPLYDIKSGCLGNVQSKEKLMALEQLSKQADHKQKKTKAIKILNLWISNMNMLVDEALQKYEGKPS